MTGKPPPEGVVTGLVTAGSGGVLTGFGFVEGTGRGVETGLGGV